MKGISPIVASVLLIAITMTIAGVLAFWSSTFVSSTLPNQNTTNAQCQIAQFEFQNCRYNSTSGNLIFSLENIKTVELTRLTAFVEFQNGSISSGISLNSTLSPSEIKSFSVSGVSSDFSKHIIKTNCPELSRSDTCLR